jgi:hypothetical protein
MLHFDNLSKPKNAQRINILIKMYFFEHHLQAKTLFIFKETNENIFFAIGIAVALQRYRLIKEYTFIYKGNSNENFTQNCTQNFISHCY